MPLPRRKPRRSPLTAAATRITTPVASDYTRRLAMPWQNRALYYTDAIGELHYASQFYARMLQRLRIFPAILTDEDKLEAIESGPPVEILNRIQDPGGGRTSILGMYGKLMFITGEGFLFGQGFGGDAPEKWSFVWREELRFDEYGKVTHVFSPNVPYETLNLSDDKNFKPLPEGSAEAYRMWTPHPRFSAWPDSPMLAVLDEAEELLVLSRSVLATATSRLVRAPLLAIPEEIAPAPPQADGDEDPMNDPFLRDFTAHLTRAIEDPSLAESLAPYVLYAGSEWIDKIKPIFLHNTDTDYLERDLRTECIRRIARGLDLPPEVVEGMSDANHWAAWWISDDMWRSHGAPKAEQFCDDLSEAYLRPALRAEGFEDWARVVVAYDASAVVVNPDRSRDADQAALYGMISDKGFRVMKNIPEDFAPSVEEKQLWAATKKVVLDENGEVVVAEPGAADANTGDPTNPGDQPGPPDGQPGDVSESTGLPASGLKMQGAVELAVLRCRELAGSRLRSKQKSCPHCLEAVAHLPNALVASGLGRAGIEPLGSPDPRKLVEGGSDGLRALMLAWGYPEDEVKTVSDFVELHAARTLFNEKPSVPALGMVA